MRQSGGHIWLYSEPGQGTIFKIYLPRAGAAEATQREEGAEDLVGSSVGRVLLVEDDDVIRGLAAHVLRADGLEIVEAAAPEAALALAGNRGSTSS